MTPLTDKCQASEFLSGKNLPHEMHSQNGGISPKRSKRRPSWPVRPRIVPPVRRRRGSVAAVVAAVTIAVIAGCAPSNSSGARSASPAGGGLGPGRTLIAPDRRERLPALSGRTLTGRPLSLAGVVGRGVVVVNVWASWCVECRAESAGLAALDRTLSARGVRFVGIDEQDAPARARRFVESVGARYPSLVDRSGRLLARLVLLPNSGIPSTLIVDRDGRMAARIVGIARRAVLARLIARVAAGG